MEGTGFFNVAVREARSPKPEIQSGKPDSLTETDEDAIPGLED